MQVSQFSRILIAFFCTTVFTWGVRAVTTEKTDDIKKFRESREASLKKNWLVVVGLSWLKPGENLVGSASSSAVALPKSSPEKLGKLFLQNGKVEVQFESTAGVKLNEAGVQTGKRYPLLSDKSGRDMSIVTIGSVKFFVIERAHGIGVRVKDSESETLKNFQGLAWWEANPEFRILGRWQKFSQPRKIMIPDILGDANEETLEGNVAFTFKGEKYELFPTRDGDSLFFVFKDQTSGKVSYGTGRFLDSSVATDGSVILDFNRAYNPPCAYITYATCPIAPVENRLGFAIEAGEKKPPNGH